MRVSVGSGAFLRVLSKEAQAEQFSAPREQKQLQIVVPRIAPMNSTTLMDYLATEVLAFIKGQPEWAAFAIGLIAFGESFVFLSLLFPGTSKRKEVP